MKNENDDEGVEIEITGSRTALVVQFFFPDKVLSVIPNKELIGGKLIKVVPVLFTQGINERQTLANLKKS